MRTRDEASVSAIRRSIGTCVTAVLAGLFTLFAAPIAAPAQTFSVLHAFTGGADGANPGAGLTIDTGGRLYGTTEQGGNASEGCAPTCGTVFRIARSGAGWYLSPLYEFHGAG